MHGQNLQIAKDIRSAYLVKYSTVKNTTDMVSIASKTATTWGYLGSSSPNSGMVCRTNVIVEITTIARDMKPITYNRMLKIMHTRRKIEFDVQSLEKHNHWLWLRKRSLGIQWGSKDMCGSGQQSIHRSPLLFSVCPLGSWPVVGLPFLSDKFPALKTNKQKKKRSWEQMYQNILSRQTNNT